MPSLSTLPDDLRLFAKYHLVRRSVTYPAPETELGIEPLGYAPDAYVEDLRARGDRFEISTLAEVEYDGRTHPMLEILAPAERPLRRLLVLAGVHGNEHAGLLAIGPLLDRLTDAPFEAVEIRIVTPCNPVGAAELSRYNAEGYDINRDFVRFYTPEARAIREVADRARPDFVVSLHEGPHEATFMFANRHVKPDVAARLLAALEDGGTELAREDYLGMTLDPPGLSPMTPVAWGVQKLWGATLGMGTTGMWFDGRGVPELTLESSWRLPDADTRVRAHVDLVLAVAAELADQVGQ